MEPQGERAAPLALVVDDDRLIRMVVREALEQYREFKRSLEAISELNQFLLRLDREESKQQERQP